MFSWLSGSTTEAKDPVVVERKYNRTRFLLEAFYSLYCPDLDQEVDELCVAVDSKLFTLDEVVNRLCSRFEDRGAILEDWTGPQPKAVIKYRIDRFYLTYDPPSLPKVCPAPLVPAVAAIAQKQHAAATSSKLYQSLVGLTEALPQEAIIFPSHCGMQFSGHSVEPKWSCRLGLVCDGCNHAVTLLPTHRKQSRTPPAGAAAFAEYITSLMSLPFPFPKAFVQLHRENLTRLSDSRIEPPRSTPFVKLSPKAVADSVASPEYHAALKRALACHVHSDEHGAQSATPIVIDVRSPGVFPKGFVKGSLCFPAVEGVRFEHFMAAIVVRDPSLSIILVCDPDEETGEGTGISNLQRVQLRMESIGLAQYVKGYALYSEVHKHAPEVAAECFERVCCYSHTLQVQKQQYIDVRSSIENTAQTVDSCVHVPLETVADWSFHEANRRRHAGEADAPVMVTFCAGGFRSLIAAAIMRAFGIPTTDVSDGGLTIMSTRPDLWILKDPSIKCTS
eukprot:TRINITY_DN498_c0_g2_i2.p1 TRINITY_DN498_c0_g2~~TRINITY_DN498_c0_g2_i2.p1  ORF type:complete len:505 (+),score=190.75 TRINITY_DN498_c0_g2_i2:83-1597(+)